jgi:hypothetical protein
MSANEVDTDFMILALTGLGAGLHWFFTGWRDLKIKRAIQDTPTSRIATGAVGSGVEIEGWIICDADKRRTAPISECRCAFYSVEIQKLVERENSKEWVTIDVFYSDPGFFVADGSGANALVLVEGAEINRGGGQAEAQAEANDYSRLPPLLLKALADNEKQFKEFKFKSSFWSSSRQCRFLEWCFTEGENIYVLGYAESGVKAPAKIKFTFDIFLKAKKMIETDAKLKQRFDTNKDGKLSPEEMERGAQTIGRQLAAQYAPKQAEDLQSKIKLVFKKTKPHPFIISNMRQRTLVAELNIFSSLKLIFGPVVTLVCFAYLVHVLAPFIL